MYARSRATRAGDSADASTGGGAVVAGAAGDGRGDAHAAVAIQNAMTTARSRLIGF